MTTLRIAIFSESYLPYLSGVTVSTEALVRGLGMLGHHVLLLAPAPRAGEQPGTAGASGPEPEYAWLPSYQGPPPAPAGYRMPFPLPSRALRRVQELRPQIIHAQSPFVTGLMARRAAQRAGSPLVFTHHTRFADYRHYLGPLAAPGAAAVRAYLRDYWAGCAAVVAPGTELGDEIRAELDTRRRPTVRVIPTGVDVAAIRGHAPIDPRGRHGWPAEAVVAISIGRLAPEKSPELLLDAFGVAVAEEPRLRLLLVGGGPAESAVRERVESGQLRGLVALTGRLPRAEALALARGSDLFIFASRTETQGLVLAEALAAGLPVVARSGPGVADAVRDGVDGLVVPAVSSQADAEAIGSALAKLATADDRRRTMAEAANRGADRFEVRRRVAEIADLYAELLPGRTAEV